MRRFEYKDAKSHKFWEIELEGDAFTVRYGKLGTDGQVQTKTFASSVKAEAEAEKVIKSKTKKGYAEVVVDAKTKASAAAKSAPAGARNLELEAAIADAPADVGAWQVYADWLQAQGDPWGERISLGLQRDAAKAATKAKLSDTITAYESEHAEALYGKTLVAMMKKDFAQVASVEAPYGLFMSATVKSPEYDWKGTAPNTVLGALVKSPAARLLRALNIGMLDHDYPVSLAKGIEAIIKVGKLENLRELFLGDFEYPDENEISWVAVGNVAKVLPVVPQLRSLRLRGGEIKLGALEHPTLESLTIETGGLPASAVASIGKCKLPQLQRMEVWLGTSDYGGDGRCKQLAGLFEGSGVPKLEHLGLQNSEFQDDIAVALAKSKVIKRLTSVDLSMGTMRERGANAIVDNASKFSKLRSLDLSENYISDELCDKLRGALGRIVMLGEQREADDYGDDEAYYYTSVGE
ncbi:Molybdate metabolism regulator [Enhygromyxa salina]|uniref:Molybdate metabolism regulator n=1 Tax=Enhygromyxa salina TaxID=215803 RepID=A0A0C2CRR8_9BACT|nr:WGR domain-containing protein [Enhygromyxa salina]KIG13886.1 Molybdate metabolism regulator [Enhygromyxa salina]